MMYSLDLLQSKGADEETTVAILYHSFESGGVKQGMAFFEAVRHEPRSGGVELWCTCLACLLAGGANDDIGLKVALELRENDRFEPDEISAQLIFATLLRQIPPPGLHLYAALEALVIDGLLTTCSNTEICNAALRSQAQFAGDAKAFWRVFDMMRQEDIEQLVHRQYMYPRRLDFQGCF